MAKQLSGTLLGDKSYISKDLFEAQKGIRYYPADGGRKGMQAPKHTPEQKRLLKQRGAVETIFDQLKNLCQIEQRCRRFWLNLISGLVAYCLFPYKPIMFEKSLCYPISE